MNYFGDFVDDATVYVPFNTFDSNDPSASVTITDLAQADVEIYKDGVIQATSGAGVTLSLNVGANNGSHLIAIDTSDVTDAGFYATGSDYQVRINGTTIDGATINAWVGTFSIQNRFMRGTDSALLAASVTISDGAIKSDMTHIHGSALTETAGQLAAAFKKLFDVATPLLVASDVMVGTDGANTTVPDAAGTAAVPGDAMNLAADAIKAVSYDESTAFPLTAVNGSTLTEAGGDGDHLTAINLPNQTMDITGSLSGSVGSVSGAVGSVAGNVDGNVSGTVTPGSGAEVDVTKIHGSALTETAGGRLAAAFVKLFDVVTPLLVASDVMRGTDGANTTVPDAAGTAASLHSTTDGKVDAVKTEVDKIGTVPVLDGAGQTIGAAIAKLADDNGGADFDATTDSLQAIRDRGDAAWTGGGGGGDATEAKQDTIIAAIGSPANIDSGGATLADNLKKMADDNKP